VTKAGNGVTNLTPPGENRMDSLPGWTPFRYQGVLSLSL